jgi:hypothetical protein
MEKEKLENNKKIRSLIQLFSCGVPAHQHASSHYLPAFFFFFLKTFCGQILKQRSGGITGLEIINGTQKNAHVVK